jgi:2-keto-3-deoxy-L-rhamnonate aldolase RhmA
MNGFQKNRLLEMLERKLVPLGMQSFSGNNALIEILGLTGFDFVMLDCEHANSNARAMEDLIRVAECSGLIPFVRVPDRRNETDMRRALEAGAAGLFIPMIRSAEDVRFVANACFFPPQGERGICPAIRAANFSFRSWEEYARWNNEEILLIPMIEHPDAVAAIEEICALDSVRVIVFGAGDLSYAMGCGTQMRDSPAVRQAYETVLACAKRHGVAVIGGPILDPTPESCRQALQDGVSCFCLGLDTLGFRKECERTVTALNRGLKGTGYSRPPAPTSGFK